MTHFHKNPQYKISQNSIQCELSCSCRERDTIFQCLSQRYADKSMQFLNLLINTLLHMHLTFVKYCTLQKQPFSLESEQHKSHGKNFSCFNSIVKCKNMQAENFNNVSYCSTYLFLSQILRNILWVKMRSAEKHNFKSILITFHVLMYLTKELPT